MRFSLYTERTGMYFKEPQLLGCTCLHNLPVRKHHHTDHIQCTLRRRHIVAICYSMHLSTYEGAQTR